MVELPDHEKKKLLLDPKSSLSIKATARSISDNYQERVYD